MEQVRPLAQSVGQIVQRTDWRAVRRNGFQLGDNLRVRGVEQAQEAVRAAGGNDLEVAGLAGQVGVVGKR